MDDPFRHFHVLFGAHRDNSSASLIYGTSQEPDSEEISAKVPIVLVDPASQNRLTKPTYFHCPVVVTVHQRLLGNSYGTVSEQELKEIRSGVKRAIGTSTGPASTQPRGVRSVRGMVVEVTKKYRDLYDTKYFAILTMHECSWLGRDQIFAPLYSSAEREPAAGASVVSIRTPAALRACFPNAENIFCLPQQVRSYREYRVVARITDRCLDDSFLKAIEAAACARWGV